MSDFQTMAESKKVYLNGQLVGEVPVAINNEEGMRLAMALLKEKGLYESTSLVQGMFRQAVSFATTASYLYKRDLTTVPRNGMSLAPFVVNSAFAIELYLKTLGQLHNTPLRGHDLLSLFDLLPDSARDALLSHFASSQWQCGLDSLDGFRGEIAAMRGAFVEWRYLFEKERAAEIKFQPMIFVMEVMHNACKAHDEIRKERTVPSIDVADP